jgi:glucosamine-6-phosphate deaminase
VLVLSPHPDDDVISMGGTLCRLVDHGHEVHIAYEVSGANAVSDDAVWRVLAFVRDSELVDAATRKRLEQLCAQLPEGTAPASTELSRWKGLIRRHEAISAARVCGVNEDRLHFLDLPLYNAAPRSRRYGADDVAAMRRLLDTVRPHLIYAAGDLDDPHGTHRLCLHVLRDALAQSAAADAAWFKESEIWLYRGAWAEWPLDEIDLAVPLSPQEVLRRRRAIFRHETQKDQALFLGEDRREFWQRTEDRSRRLAQAYNALGLAEYEAIEAFRRYAPADFVRSAAF